MKFRSSTTSGSGTRSFYPILFVFLGIVAVSLVREVEGKACLQNKRALRQTQQSKSWLKPERVK